MSESSSNSDSDDFKRAGAVMQVFSSVAFAGLFCWLVTTNGRKLTAVRKEPYEKRIEVVVNLCIYVAMISAFCNLFQLTTVDDNLLPRQDNYVVDMARPVEWILTCPFMQLALVLIGGEKFPEYRLVLMPFLSVLILGCGTITQLFAEIAFVWVFFLVGFCLFCVLLYFNRKQILEMTNEQEGLWSGEHPFRTATLILMVTWVPFPIWFALSPEGTGLIQDVMMIQGGWAFFNIASKFILIFFLQSMKEDLKRGVVKDKEKQYSEWDQSMANGMQNTRKVSAEIQKGDLSNLTNIIVASTPVSPTGYASDRKLSSKLLMAVNETLSKIEWGISNEELCQRLRDAGIFSPGDLVNLTEDHARQYELPLEFIHVLQHHIEQVTMEDSATRRTSTGGLEQLPAMAMHWSPSADYNGHQKSPGPTRQDIVNDMKELFNAKHDELMASIQTRNDELLRALDKREGAKYNEVLAMVAKAQATTERSEAKVDKCIQMVEKATSCLATQTTELQNGQHLTIFKQQMDAQHMSLVQQQSNWHQSIWLYLKVLVLYQYHLYYHALHTYV
jgi:bacteriorhodopsin